MPNYPQEQLWQLYKDLPKDLQEAGFSEKVAQNIHEICTKNGIRDEDIIFDVSESVGYVFLGLLPPDEFCYVLEKDLKMEKIKAELITAEITRFVFLPVRTSLEALYKIEIKPSVKPGGGKVSSSLEAPVSRKKLKKDTYREPLE